MANSAGFLSLKIASASAEAMLGTMARRQVPDIPKRPINAIAGLEKRFVNYGNLSLEQANGRAATLKKELGFNDTVDSIEQLRSKAKFRTALAQPENRAGFIRILEQYIEKGGVLLSVANKLVLAMIENGTISLQERLVFEFLKAKIENRAEAFGRLGDRSSDRLFRGLCFYYYAQCLISAGKYNQVTGFFTARESRLDHPFLQGIKQICWADAALAQNKLAEAQGGYQCARELFIAAQRHQMTVGGADIKTWHDQTLKEVGKEAQARCGSGLEALSALNKKKVKPAERYFQLAETVLMIESCNSFVLVSDIQESRLSGDQQVIARAVQVWEQNLPCLIAKEGQITVLLVMAEQLMAAGRIGEARKYYSAEPAKGSFHARTRLNEIAYAEVFIDGFPGDRVGQLVIDLEAEYAQRKRSFGRSKDELLIILSQLIELSSRAHLPEPYKRALTSLEEETRGSPIHPYILLFIAAKSHSTVHHKRMGAVVNIPGEIPTLPPAQALVIGSVYEGESRSTIVEYAREVQRRLQETPEFRRQIQSLLTPDDLSNLPEIAGLYEVAAQGIRDRFETVLLEALNRERVFFRGTVINPFKIVHDCGIHSVEFELTPTQAINVIIHTNDGGRVLMSFDEKFEFRLTENQELNKLITLMVIDYFLAVQLGQGYSGAFERIDYRFFVGSEALQGFRGKAKQLVVRPPSATEAAIDELAAAGHDQAAAPIDQGPSPEGGPGLDDERIGKKKSIFQVITFRRLSKGQRIVIDIPKQASLLPLAQLLDSLELEATQDKAVVLLRSGQNVIRVEISESGDIMISDQNRGSVDLQTIRAMNEIILDVLNAHFIRAYNTAIKQLGPHSAEAIERIFSAIQNTAEMRARKLAVYQGTPAGQRTFTVEIASGADNPFEAVFFEAVGTEPVNLRPLTEMNVTEAIEAVRQGRRIVQVGVVRTHRFRQAEPLSGERLRQYIRHYILGIDKRVGDLTAKDLRDVERVIERIRAGESTLDPNGFIRIDSQHPLGISMAEVVEISGAGEPESRTVHMNYRRAYLRAYDISETSAGAMMVTRAELAEPPVEPAPAQTRPVEPPIEEKVDELSHTARATAQIREILRTLRNDFGLYTSDVGTTEYPGGLLHEILEGRRPGDTQTLIFLRKILLRKKRERAGG